MGSSILLALVLSDGMRPVFLIMMGSLLVLYCWRLARNLKPWPRRLTMAGAILLACGYCYILPATTLGAIERYVPNGHMHDPASALAWSVARLFAMNFGWFCLGLGLALHAGVFGQRQSAPPQFETTLLSRHREPIL